MAQKTLIAFDDSENAMRAVEFVCNHFNRDSQVTLFSVIPDTAAICEMNSPSLSPYFVSHQTTFCALEDQKRDLVKEEAEKARELLVKSGFNQQNIAIKINTRKKGVAKDIVDEAHSGYDAIVIGRRGLSGFEEFIFGSVSNKVVQTVKDASIVLVS